MEVSSRTKEKSVFKIGVINGFGAVVTLLLAKFFHIHCCLATAESLFQISVTGFRSFVKYVRLEVLWSIPGRKEIFHGIEWWEVATVNSKVRLHGAHNAPLVAAAAGPHVH